MNRLTRAILKMLIECLDSEELDWLSFNINSHLQDEESALNYLEEQYQLAQLSEDEQ